MSGKTSNVSSAPSANPTKKKVSKVARVGLLTVDKNKKSSSAPAAPKVGFVGGLNKLREIQNNIPVSDGDKPQPKLVRSARDKNTFDKIEQPALTKEPSDEASYDEIDDEESSALETIDSENEDMARFCKRMCKKTNAAMQETQQRQKDIEKINFRKARKRFVNSKLENFRVLVKEHIQQGKMILFEYKKNDAFDGFLVYKLLTDGTDESGLKILAETIDPFRMFHYREGDKWVVEITWAVPSLKNTTLKPNKLPEKVKRKVRKSAPEPVPEPVPTKIRTKSDILKYEQEQDVIVMKQKFAKSQK